MPERDCLAVLGRQRGEQVHEMIERATGMSCRCQRGEMSPLLDDEGDSPVLGAVPVLLRTG